MNYEIMAAIILIVAFLIYAFAKSKSMTDAEKQATISKVYEDFANAIKDASALYTIPQKRIAAIISVESGGDPDTPDGTSGERGLMQIEQGALTDFNRVYGENFSFDELYDIPTNIRVGTGYLAWLNRELNSLDLATRAYNAGIGTIEANPSADQAYLNKVLSFENQISVPLT